MGVVLSQPAIVDNMMSVCGDDIKALFFEKLAEYSGSQPGRRVPDPARVLVDRFLIGKTGFDDPKAARIKGGLFLVRAMDRRLSGRIPSGHGSQHPWSPIRGLVVKGTLPGRDAGMAAEIDVPVGRRRIIEHLDRGVSVR